ncbi:protein of unassigned function [Methylobacterium oryzae CBMB20]|uniref:Protein of unassigned function n=1 Tax=Methylobacterium oryzae CBMB20 TaxID=693986 RepID=A0A089P229_9HYPH|nr:protein of unassigned function [Methylobacterium oryzae CBMB20]
MPVWNRCSPEAPSSSGVQQSAYRTSSIAPLRFLLQEARRYRIQT